MLRSQTPGKVSDPSALGGGLVYKIQKPIGSAPITFQSCPPLTFSSPFPPSPSPPSLPFFPPPSSICWGIVRSNGVDFRELNQPPPFSLLTFSLPTSRCALCRKRGFSCVPSPGCCFLGALNPQPRRPPEPTPARARARLSLLKPDPAPGPAPARPCPPPPAPATAHPGPDSATVPQPRVAGGCR